jgi:phosphoribosylformimino-5-aminoimidazole carboxamide ribotide isomerase
VEFRPCIDLHKGKVKQIVGSSLKDLATGDAPTDDEPLTNFETEKCSAEFAELYKKDGLTGGHVIMLSGEFETLNKPTPECTPARLNSPTHP